MVIGLRGMAMTCMHGACTRAPQQHTMFQLHTVLASKANQFLIIADCIEVESVASQQAL